MTPKNSSNSSSRSLNLLEWSWKILLNVLDESSRAILQRKHPKISTRYQPSWPSIREREPIGRNQSWNFDLFVTKFSISQRRLLLNISSHCLRTNGYDLRDLLGFVKFSDFWISCLNQWRAGKIYIWREEAFLIHLISCRAKQSSMISVTTMLYLASLYSAKQSSTISVSTTLYLLWLCSAGSLQTAGLCPNLVGHIRRRSDWRNRVRSRYPTRQLGRYLSWWICRNVEAEIDVESASTLARNRFMQTALQKRFPSCNNVLSFTYGPE